MLQPLTLLSGIPRQGLNTELDDVETRLEEYPMTLAFLHLLDVLTDRLATDPLTVQGSAKEWSLVCVIPST